MSLLSTWLSVPAEAPELATLVLGALAGLVVILILLAWRALQAVQRAEQRLEGLGHLEGLDKRVKALVESQGGLDLRRLEHLLVDLRDLQRRSDERVSQVLEAAQRTPAEPPTPGAPPAARLSERVVNRLVSLGYERIELLTNAEEFEALAEGDGEVVVEARRGGAAYKGRVQVKQGAIVSVALKAPYEIFP